MSQGKLFLILGPSGSGKGTVIAHLHKAFPEAVFPVSCTTRNPRPGEIEGDVYNYISKNEFKEKIEKKEFLEWAIVHNDNYYGTLKAPIAEALEDGKTVIREVDMQGVQSIRELLPGNQVVSIFITARSWEGLKERIVKRAKISDDSLAHREKSFAKEMEFSKECKYVVFSEDGKIPETNNEVEGIIREEMVES